MRRQWSSLFSRVVSRLGIAAKSDSRNMGICSSATATTDVVATGEHGPDDDASHEEQQHQQKEAQDRRSGPQYSRGDGEKIEVSPSVGSSASDQERRDAEASVTANSATLAQAEPASAGSLARFCSKGTLEGKYEVLDDVLGSGQYAVVRLCRERRSGKLRAVKLIERKRTSPERLGLEIDVLLRLRGHPNVVGLFDVYLTEESVQLVMEFVPGGELFEHLVSNGPYSEAEAARFMKRIASAVEYLHRNKIVHRDLKPENILLTSRDARLADVKVADFGLARMYTESAMRTVCGTWAYAAPEVRNDPIGYDAKVDVWSMGVIMYVLLVAFHPFDTTGTLSEDELWYKIENGMFDFRDKAWRKISEEAKDLIDRMLVLDPEKRLSAEEVLAHPWLCGCQQPLEPLSSQINTDLAATRARYAKRKLGCATKAVWAQAAFAAGLGAAAAGSKKASPALPPPPPNVEEEKEMMLNEVFLAANRSLTN